MKTKDPPPLLQSTGDSLSTPDTKVMFFPLFLSSNESTIFSFSSVEFQFCPFSPKELLKIPRGGVDKCKSLGDPIGNSQNEGHKNHNVQNVGGDKPINRSYLDLPPTFPQLGLENSQPSVL